MSAFEIYLLSIVAVGILSIVGMVAYTCNRLICIARTIEGGIND